MVQTKKLMMFGADVPIEDIPYNESCSIKKSKRVMKVNSEPDHVIPDGHKGITVGCEIIDGQEGYLVQWDTLGSMGTNHPAFFLTKGKYIKEIEG